MADKKPKSPDEILRQVQERLQIRDVYLRKVSTEMSSDFIPILASGDQFTVQTRINCAEIQAFDLSDKAQPERTTHMIEFHVEVGARFLRNNNPDSDDDHPPETDVEASKVVEINAVFAALYEYEEGEIAQRELRQFGDRNAPFHVWPYWREFLHSLTARIHLPGAVIPMRTLPRLPTGKQVDESMGTPGTPEQR